MTAAIYCRVSTEGQEREGTSLESQLDANLCRAKELGFETDGYIIKEVWSGLALERPGLTGLRDWVKQKQVEAVIAYSTDRLSRDPVHLLVLAEEFDKAGVKLIFVTEPMDNTLEGQLLGFVKGWASKVEAVKIRERTMRGKRTRAQLGKLPTGGLNLYGYYYDKETGKRAINPNEATVIRKMVDYVLKDRRFLNDVCRRLMAENIPSPRGGQKWSRATLGRILNNEVYTGKTYAMKMRAIEPKTRKKVGRYKNTARELRPREEWVLLPDDTTPQIITPEEYEALQAQLARNRELSPRNQKFQYLLRGFLYCRKCNRKYYGIPVHGKRYYRCSGKSSVLSFGQPCDTGLVNADQLEAKVWGLVAQNIFEPNEWVEVNRNQSTQDLELRQLREELTVIRNRLELLDNAETKLIRLFEFTPMSEAKVKQECDRIQEEKHKAEDRLAQLEKEVNNYKETTLTDEEIRALAIILKQIFLKASSEDEAFDQKHRILEILNLKVWIGKESFSVDLKIPSVPTREHNTVSTPL